jgi:DHA3 family macrolide efflux protein-like MFS transporter
MTQKTASHGMRIFIVVWFGQLVSTIGSGLTGFVLGVWVYQETGSTTLFAMNMLAYAIPNLVVSPFAGALVDRYDRRKIMILSDSGAGLATLSVAALLVTGNLEVWHVFLATAVSATFTTFQWPAYSATTTLLVPKEQLGRAGGMVQIGEAVSQLLAPAAAGALFVTTGLQGVVLIDFVTYLIAVCTLLFVRFPQPETTKQGEESKGTLLSEAVYGWKYIAARSGLLGLLLIFAAFNFLNSLTNPLLAPMILDMTTADVFGYLASIVGVGMLIGTLVMSAWGGPKRRIHGVLFFLFLAGLFTMGFGISPSLTVMAVAGFLLMLVLPVINGSSQAIWQSKVAPDVQGRVFAVRRMIAWSIIPIAYVLAGPLNDKIFKPLLVEGGTLANTIVGQIVGVGPSRGTGLLFIVIGLLSALVALSGYLSPRVRNVEDELPDVITEASTEQDEPTVEGEPSQIAAVSGD